MDILSHGLWGATIVRKRKLVWWALLAGMAPDILGSAAAFVYLLTIGKFWGTASWQYLPQWTKDLYLFNHSLLAVLIYWIVLFVFAREYDILILPYIFHVLLDVFTHDTIMLNRLFYPAVFQSGMQGLNWWQHWWIMGLNIAGLALINGFLFIRRRIANRSVAS